VSSAATNDQSGYSVSSAWDVNGDGIDDLIIGAPAANSFAGASYVVFGKASGYTANLDLSTLDGTPTGLTYGFKINGAAAEDLFGESVSSAGDINHDGYADLIVGASQPEFTRAC
jgi:hypothetical protein